GSGTLELTGNNTYTGTTTVAAGTLALVGGSQSSAVAVDPGASLGFALGAPTTSTASVDLTSGTVKITGTPTLSSYTLITASSILGTPVLHVPVPGYQLVVAAGGTELQLSQTGSSSPYATWSGGAAFAADANGDGVSNGMAFLLGAANPSTNAIGLLPAVTQNSGNLVLTFTSLKAANRGTAVPKIEYSKDLGITDLWTSHGDAVVPETSSTVAGVTFVITAHGNPALWNVQATIPASAASPGTKLFGRLNAVNP
ncbi:MAG TPA: autotransporter-associated beta strand repeat-containing protein, partial [Verrucomicrobiae bacterium]|nr:autotransporter-associated beta strand repeat-containing protein [Verrucomicrobiae bacterium]